MNPVTFALRRPFTVIVCVVAVVLACSVALRPRQVDQSLQALGIELPLQTMKVDIFPALNLPVVYVCQPYGGMDPAQMEGLLTNYYEYHFLYISGIHHVESRNIQGMALMKLHFHAGTDMAQAMAETINYVNRSRAFMPPGTVSPFVMRFDTGSVPVGYLVLSSETKTVGEIQDQALFKVRPMFSTLPGVSAPPPFGGSARTIVIRADPERLRSYSISPDEVVTALASGNAVSPSGNLHVGTSYPVVPTNALVKDIRDLGSIPIRTNQGPPVYVRDIGTIEDATDLQTGYALVNGRRAVYILATKRAEASTMSVIDEIKKALPAMQAELPSDIKVSFEFDQSPYVTRAINSLFAEGVLGAILTGLMVLLFLRDWRSALVVVLNIPLAIMASILGLWLCGHTINLMTLGGLALSVGILVDEATVEIENIHTQYLKTDSIALAVRLGNAETAIPRLLAMLCILAVFVPSFFMQGAARNLFVPLSLAVGFSMTASYILSSTFVPVLSVWLLRHNRQEHSLAAARRTLFDRIAGVYSGILRGLVAARWIVVPVYLAVSLAVVVVIGFRLGIEIFPSTGVGEFRLRFRAPDGTHFDTTEQYALGVLDAIRQHVGPQNVEITLGYVGTIPSSFPINGVYQWSRGPEEGLLRISLRQGSGIDTERAKDELRDMLAQQFPELRFSFEPADIVSEVMSFGSPTPLEIAARGANLVESRDYMLAVQQELKTIPALRDVQISQSLDYPTVNVVLDREKASYTGTTASQIARSVVAATSSTRFVVQNYWPDPKTGIGYQVQVEIPQPVMTQPEDLATIPINYRDGQPLLLRDVAQISPGTMAGQFDRYNMKREITLTANISGQDLGSVAGEVNRVLAKLDAEGKRPKSVTTELRGQIPPLRQIVSGLGVGLALAILVIFLLLTANFQSLRLALTTVSTVPAVLTGVVLSLWLTGSTLNIQSFIGAIMAVGVAMANAILLVTFAEQSRRRSGDSKAGAVEAGERRLRAILMTSLAMGVGMVPMALGSGEEGAQAAPLGRAVIGGLAAATMATLLVLPAVFALIQRRAPNRSASLDPVDPHSALFRPEAAALLALLIGISLPGCQQQSQQTEGAVSGEQAPAKATVILPQRKPLVRLVELPGRIEAYEETPLYAKATGYVIHIPVDVGDTIRGPQGDAPGTLLCELQVPELKEELGQKSAAVAQAEAEVLQSDASVKVAEAAVRAANAKVAEAKAAIEREESVYVRWQSEFERVSQLAESGAVSKKVADETRAQRDAADAGRNEVAARVVTVEAQQQEVLADLEKSKADAVAARSRLAVAQADERRVAAMMDYTLIRAPFDGVVVARNVHTGHLVQSGAGSHKPLLVVMRTDPVRVLIDVPEVDAVHITSETKVEIRIPSLPGSSWEGTITRSSWSLNSTSRTMSAEVHVPNPEGNWRPGQYVQAKLTAADVENCLSLPRSAIITQDKQTCCFAVDTSGKVVRIPISLGLQAGPDVEIRDGLTGDEQIISVNAGAFREGQIVEATPPAK